MKPVKSPPRFRCDFCNHVSTQSAMIRHERICWKNPNRFCDACQNTKRATVEYDYGMTEEVECWFCKQFDPTRLDPIGAMKEGQS